MLERQRFEQQARQQEAERQAQPDWLPRSRRIAQFVIGAVLVYFLFVMIVTALGNL